METLASLFPLILLVLIFYFMLIRPQRRRVEQHRRLLDSIELGDEVVTIGGIHGTVRRLGDDELEVEIAPGVKVRVNKSAVAHRKMDELESDEAEIGTTSEEEA